MRRIIAVDDDLGYLRERLSREGYEVKSVRDGVQDADAVVSSGLSDNIMGIQDRRTDAFIIEARGKNEEEILADLECRFKLKD